MWKIVAYLLPKFRQTSRFLLETLDRFVCICSSCSLDDGCYPSRSLSSAFRDSLRPTGFTRRWCDLCRCRWLNLEALPSYRIVFHQSPAQPFSCTPLQRWYKFCRNWVFFGKIKNTYFPETTVATASSSSLLELKLYAVRTPCFFLLGFILNYTFFGFCFFHFSASLINWL